MDRMVGIEDARGKLGDLVRDVASGGEPIQLMKWGQAMAVLVSREEYSRLKVAASRLAREEMKQRIEDLRTKVAAEGVDPSVVDEAIAAIRGAE